MSTDQSYGVIVANISNPSELRFLLIQGYDKRWGFPKGGTESEDGSQLETALRELAEETNIDPSTIKIVEDVIFNENYIIKKKHRPNISKTVKYFLGTTNNFDVERQSKEIRDIGWFRYNDAIKKLKTNKLDIFKDAFEIFQKLSK